MTTVKIITKNGYYYQGELIKNNDEFIAFEDRYQGYMEIRKSEIAKLNFIDED